MARARGAPALTHWEDKACHRAPADASSWYGIGAVIARGCLARRSALLAAGPLLVAGELGGFAPFVERSRRNEQADHELAMMIHLGKHPNPLEAAGMSQLFDLMHESPDHEVHTEHMNSPPPGVKTRRLGADLFSPSGVKTTGDAERCCDYDRGGPFIASGNSSPCSWSCGRNPGSTQVGTRSLTTRLFSSIPRYSRTNRSWTP